MAPLLCPIDQLKFAGVPQTPEPISAVSGALFLIVDMCLSCEDIARQSCAIVPRWRFLATFLRPVFQRAARSTFQTGILNSH